MPGRHLCLLLLLTVAIVSGCGSSESGTSSSPSTGAQPQASASSAQPVATTARIGRSPAAHGREPGTPGHPASPVCGHSAGSIVNVALEPDVPQPRCVQVSANQELRLVNRTGDFGAQPSVASVRFAGFRARIEPNHAVIFAEPFGDYLMPGTHAVEVINAPGNVGVLLR
jgi:hypothetical protein